MAITTTIGQVQAAYLAINRVPLNDTTAAAVAAAIDGGVTTLAAYQAGLVAQASTTTTAAYALSTFIEGVVPTSARIDSLTAFAKTQHDYYANVLKSEHAQLGAYEALGKAFAADPTTTASFNARYGALSATDFVTTVYASVFNGPGGGTPTAGALANLVGQIAYFTDIYTKAGIPAADAALQAKGAVLGQIIGYAATDPETPLSNPSFLDEQVEGFINQTVTDAINEAPTSNVYGVAGFGATIDLTALVGPVVPGAGTPNSSTQYADKISGTVGTNGFADTVLIDGGAGVDTVTVTTAGGNYAPAADVLNSIEKLAIVATTAAATVDVSNIQGLTDFTFAAGSNNGLTVVGLDTATTFHITTASAAVDIGYASAPAAAAISIDANYTGVIEFTDAAVKSVTANVTVADSGVNFADNDLTSVTVTSKGSISISDIGTGLKTLNLSGVGTFSNSSFGGENFANAVTATLGKGADTFLIDANKAHVVTLGGGADTLTFVQAGNVADVSTNAKVVASVASVTDFAKAEDILSLSGGARQTLDGTQLGQIAAQADLKAAAVLAGSFSAAADWAVFNFGTDAYALFDAGGDGFNVGDTLVKITGVQVSDFTATNLTVA